MRGSSLKPRRHRKRKPTMAEDVTVRHTGYCASLSVPSSTPLVKLGGGTKGRERMPKCWLPVDPVYQCHLILPPPGQLLPPSLFLFNSQYIINYTSHPSSLQGVSFPTPNFTVIAPLASSGETSLRFAAHYSTATVIHLYLVLVHMATSFC